MKSKKIVIFDFDGVIADTFELTLNMHRNVNPDLTPEEYVTFFDGNIYEVAKPKQHLYKYVDKPTKKYPYGKNFQYFFDQADKISTVPGIQKTVKKLNKKYSIFIISSTHSAVIKKILKHANIQNEFTNIYGSEISTSKVEKFKMILNEAGATTKDCIFITDTLGDLKEAEKVNIGSIIADWGIGYQPVSRVKKGKHLAVVKSPQELVASVDKYFK